MFVRYNYREGDSVKLTNNPCSLSCGCIPNNISLLKAGIKDYDTIYTIKELHHFGGGCPPISISLVELVGTHTWETALPANWFIPFNKN